MVMDPSLIEISLTNGSGSRLTSGSQARPRTTPRSRPALTLSSTPTSLTQDTHLSNHLIISYSSVLRWRATKGAAA